MPYLMYYALLSCARAVVFTNPRYEWKEELVTMKHSKTINIIGDIVSRYDKEEGKGIESFIDKSRIYREIFSYKFPAEGLRGMNLNFEKDYKKIIPVYNKYPAAKITDFFNFQPIKKNKQRGILHLFCYFF